MKQMATTSLTTSLYPLSKSRNSIKPHNYSLTISQLRATNHLHKTCKVLPLRNTRVWRISAVAEDSLSSEVVANPIDNTELVVSTTGDNGVSNIISVLLFIAFVGLSILTIGVIYIAVTDFLQKREKEKFEKEEASKGKKKKSGKKMRMKARAGPKGFGQKIEEEDDED